MRRLDFPARWVRARFEPLPLSPVLRLFQLVMRTCTARSDRSARPGKGIRRSLFAKGSLKSKNTFSCSSQFHFAPFHTSRTPSPLTRAPVCARVFLVCPGSPRCLFTGGSDWAIEHSGSLGSQVTWRPAERLRANPRCGPQRRNRRRTGGRRTRAR